MIELSILSLYLGLMNFPLKNLIKCFIIIIKGAFNIYLFKSIMEGIFMQWKIEVSYKPNATDSMGQGIKKDIEDLGITGVDDVKTIQVYIIEGEFSESDIKRICDDLLTDRVTQTYEYKNPLFFQNVTKAWIVEVRYKHGVTDAVGDSVVKGIKDLGIDNVISAKTGRKYIIDGSLSQNDVEVICKRLLANDVIQTYTVSDGDENGEC